MKEKILTILFICVCLTLNAQEKVKTTQPTIMVIPYVKEGQDIRTILEDDFNKRIAISKVKEAFDNRGFTTKDFVSTLKIGLKENVLNSQNKDELKSALVRMSGADMYVEVEIDLLKSSSGNSVKLILQAFDAFTGQSLSNKIGESGKFYTDDIAKLSQKSVENCSEEFLNTLNQKFGDIIENGRSVRLVFGFSSESEYDMDSEANEDGDLISDMIEDWLDENAFKNNFHIQGMTSTTIIVDDFRIPLKDETGKNYRASKVRRKIRNYIKNQMGMMVKADMEGSTKINIIIQ